MAHCFSVVDFFYGKFVKAIIELPFTGEFVTDGWLPNILVNKPRTAEEIAKTSISVCFANERSDNTCHQFSLFSSNAWLLSQATQPNGRTNLLTNFWTWIALTGKMLEKSSSGKAVLCSNTFTYLFDTCYRDWNACLCLIQTTNWITDP